MIPARLNPFAVDRVLRIRYRTRELAREQILQRLAAMQYRAAIVGPDGTGKTTLLEDLESPLRALGFEIRHARLDRATRLLPADQRRSLLGGLGPRHVILFDGADHMPRPLWPVFRFRTRCAGGLIITSHRTGLLPTLLATDTSVELLAELVRELLGPDFESVAPLLPQLFQRHRGNLRDCLRELYDTFASR